MDEARCIRSKNSQIGKVENLKGTGRIRINEPFPLLYCPSCPATSARWPEIIRDKAPEVVTPMSKTSPLAVHKLSWCHATNLLPRSSVSNSKLMRLSIVQSISAPSSDQ